ncbi:MAG: 4-hydroxybenzoate octaprenyltransferase [Rhodospirillaceae bacterium]|nr:4-hydroxybenzoate octaprenyltransferase [Rhodospirillaceae bacterium]
MNISSAPHSEEQKLDATDIRHGNLILRVAPKSWRPYLLLLRIDRPVGSWLLLMPCWWGTAMASNGLPDAKFIALFFFGAFIMRGAGCVFNDIIDRDFDAKVVRTALRPIPSGQVSVAKAFIFFNVMCLIGLVILLQLNMFAIWVGVASLLPLAVYPFMKRFVHFPQLFMGLAFNWGALLGWAAVRGELSLAPGLLYIAGIFWTLGYDTIYAHQDKEDDLIIGIKSLAVKLGDATRPWIAVFYALTILFILLAGFAANVGWAFYPAMILPTLHLTWQIITVDFDNAKDCLSKFRLNRDFGFLVFLAFVLGNIV